MNAAGAGPRPARGLLPGMRAFKTSPSSASLRSAPSPEEGEGLRAAKGRSYREGEIFWDGRVRTPAPTKFGESSGFFVGADDLGGPRAHSVRPYREKEAHLKCSLGEGIPSPLRGTPL